MDIVLIDRLNKDQLLRLTKAEAAVGAAVEAKAAAEERLEKALIAQEAVVAELWKVLGEEPPDDPGGLALAA